MAISKQKAIKVLKAHQNILLASIINLRVPGPQAQESNKYIMISFTIRKSELYLLMEH